MKISINKILINETLANVEACFLAKQSKRKKRCALIEKYLRGNAEM
jgi:hypothetical protein